MSEVLRVCPLTGETCDRRDLICDGPFQFVELDSEIIDFNRDDHISSVVYKETSCGVPILQETVIEAIANISHKNKFKLRLPKPTQAETHVKFIDISVNSGKLEPTTKTIVIFQRARGQESGIFQSTALVNQQRNSPEAKGNSYGEDTN